MRASSIFAAFVTGGLVLVGAQSSTGLFGDAAVTRNNPTGEVYIATIPDSTITAVRGQVIATAAEDGTGVAFVVTFSGLPTSGGPFIYHVHDQPVPTSGNCTGTLAHLDPYVRGETPACDATQPATCQVGDLSGKHGKINDTIFMASYKDLYTSTVPTIGAFLGNRSIVIHYANKTRISCANFTASYVGNGTYVSSNGTLVANETTSSVAVTPSVTGGMATGTSTPPASSAPCVTGEVGMVLMSAGAVMLGVLAFLL
ncbi:superoxide dismutase [Cryomyces antarcticus]